MLGSNRRASQTNIPSLSHRPPPPPSRVLTSPWSSLAKNCPDLCWCVIIPDFSLAQIQLLSYPSLSTFLSVTLFDHTIEALTLLTLLLSYFFSLFTPLVQHQAGLTKQLLDDIFRGSAPSYFLPTLFHKQACRSTSGGEELNSLTHYSLIWHA